MGVKRWTDLGITFIGVWLITTPLTFTYTHDLMALNDTVCGLILLTAGILSFQRQIYWVPWFMALIGVWLQFAPLAFWAPSAFLYLNDTSMGILTILLSVILPDNAKESALKGPTTPPGWNYNPSSHSQRLPIILLATACWFISRYMAAFQLGYRDTVFDPVFGSGTLDVITSWLSKDFPISDAGLGALAYTLEALMGIHGGARRWHTMPWSVLLFGFLVIPVGLVSTLLIISQPILIGHWCFWCLLTAALMLLMVAFALDEVWATLQYLAVVRQKKIPFWDTFWKGGEVIGLSSDQPEPSRYIQRLLLGLSVSWQLIATTLLGCWVMASPDVFGNVGFDADTNYICGALCVVISIISMATVAQKAQQLLIPLACVIGISPWIFWDASIPGMINDTVVAAMILSLSYTRSRYLFKD